MISKYIEPFPMENAHEMCVINSFMQILLNSDFFNNIYCREYALIYGDKTDVFDKINEKEFFSVIDNTTNVDIIKHVTALYVKARELNLSNDIQTQILYRIKFVDYILELYNKPQMINDELYLKFDKSIKISINIISRLFYKTVMSTLKCDNMFMLESVFNDINKICQNKIRDQDFYFIIETPKDIDADTIPIFNGLYLMTKYIYANNYVCTDMLLKAKHANDKSFSHISYYNIMEEKLQSDDVIFNVPITRLLFLKSYTEQSFIIKQKSVNMAFVSKGYHKDSIISAMNKNFTHIVYVPICFHLQLINADLTKYGYSNKLGNIKIKNLEKQTHKMVTDAFIEILQSSEKNYSDYIEKLKSSQYEESIYEDITALSI